MLPLGEVSPLLSLFLASSFCCALGFYREIRMEEVLISPIFAG